MYSLAYISFTVHTTSILWMLRSSNCCVMVVNAFEWYVCTTNYTDSLISVLDPDGGSGVTTPSFPIGVVHH